MKWVREFSNSDLFAELLSLGYGDEEDQILIRIGPQGHRLDEKRKHGRWARIYQGSGFFYYYYLVGLQKYIESGEVYQFIQDECHRNVWLAKAHVRTLDQE